MRKMKNGKRILSVFLTLSMVFSMSGAPSFAWEDAQLSKDQGLVQSSLAGRRRTAMRPPRLRRLKDRRKSPWTTP